MYMDHKVLICGLPSLISSSLFNITLNAGHILVKSGIVMQVFHRAITYAMRPRLTGAGREIKHPSGAAGRETSGYPAMQCIRWTSPSNPRVCWLFQCDCFVKSRMMAMWLNYEYVRCDLEQYMTYDADGNGCDICLEVADSLLHEEWYVLNAAIGGMGCNTGSQFQAKLKEYTF